jgi:uncharacterized protein (TIGR03437 family)
LIVNTGGAQNSALNPAQRGATITVFATGLGEVRPQGSAFEAVTPVSMVFQDVAVEASSASPAAGLVGVYSVTAAIPASIAPGLDLSLRLRQGEAESNAVTVSVR